LARPNILFIQSDQHRFDCVAANGHALIETPHLDRLAGEGVNFTQAYTPIPVCVPTRNSLMHGQWSTEHHCIANTDTEAPRPAEPGLPTFSQALRRGGYTLGCVGKWGVHPEWGPTHPAYGFHQYVDLRGYDSWRAAKGIPPRPTDGGWRGQADPFIGPEASRLAWCADQTIGLIEAAAADGAPFFVRWDSSAPHLPNVLPEPYASLYSPDAIPPWPSFPDPLIGKPYIQAQQRRTWDVEGWTWSDWAPIVGRYLGEISLLDAQVGRVLEALDRLDLTENTLVIYTTDHGDLCGGHGMVDKHYVMYDDVVRVPLIARWPVRCAPGRVCDAFVSHSIDLATTFCDVAEVPIPATFRGQSLLPLLDGASENGRDDIFSVYHGNQFGLYSQRMVRDRRWKYVWNATAEDELYDLSTDPGEVHSRAVDSACAVELGRLRQRLVAWMEMTRDPLLNGWTRTQLLEGRSV
jgi:arylsulfatase A-like enzyme